MGYTQVIDRLNAIEQSVRIQAKDILTIEEASVYTGFSKAHLYRLTCEHRIPHYKRDSRLCFDKQELKQWMTEVRIATDSETAQQAQQYINHKTNIV
jgi:excisionase family DNA binding protein